MTRLIRLLAAAAIMFSAVAPVTAASPSPAPLEDSQLPIPPAEMLETTPITVIGGRIGASVVPSSLIFTNVDDTGGIVKIGNPSDQLIRISVATRDYTIDAAGEVAVDSEGLPTLGNPAYQYTSADWYKFSYTEFLLPAGRIVKLPFSLAVPPSALPGDHTAALIVLARRADISSGSAGSGGASAVSQYRFLVRMQHRVAGAQFIAPRVSVRAEVDGSSRIDFIATIDNLGTTVLDYKPYKESDPVPTFRIRPAAGGDVLREFALPKGFYILPEANRILPVSWRDENVVEPVGTAEEVAKLQEAEQTAADLEQLAAIRSQLRVARARLALATTVADLGEAEAAAIAQVTELAEAWYATARAEADGPLSDSAISAKGGDLAASVAAELGLNVMLLGGPAALAAEERAATFELYATADRAALPPTGDYIVEFVLPKRTGGADEIIVSAPFSFVNADPNKILLSSTAPWLLFIVAGGVGAAVLYFLLVVRPKRRGEDLEAE